MSPSGHQNDLLEHYTNWLNIEMAIEHIFDTPERTAVIGFEYFHNSFHNGDRYLFAMADAYRYPIGKGNILENLVTRYRTFDRIQSLIARGFSAQRAGQHVFPEAYVMEKAIACRHVETLTAWATRINAGHLLMASRSYQDSTDKYVWAGKALGVMVDPHRPDDPTCSAHFRRLPGQDVTE